MNMPELISMLSALGVSSLDAQAKCDRDHLESKGWVCLGAECGTGKVHWTNLERGLGPGGLVTFQRAIWLQRTADAIAQQKESAK